MLNTKTTQDSPQILIAEDEAPIRMVWERFLRRWDLSANMAVDGKEALKMARENSYQLLITDLTMPIMTGQELIYTLKDEQPNIEVIVTTGQGTVEIAVEMMKAGAYDFITKPINFTSAEYTIKKCLEKVKADQENIRLRQINRDLEEVNKIKEKFIAITSHELRTPVSVISNILEILAAEFEGKEEEPLIRMVTSSSEHLQDIVNEMHEISQISSSKIDLHISIFQIKTLFDEMESELAIILENRQQKILWEAPKDLPLSADRIKIKKVLRELLQNAIKFTPNGGQIRVNASNGAGNLVEIEVSDNGIGIPEDEHEKIFQLFYEVADTMHHHTAKDDEFGSGGMGVGLAIVTDIVDAHGGRLSLKSKVDEGSNFIVSIPQQSALASAN